MGTSLGGHHQTHEGDLPLKKKKKMDTHTIPKAIADRVNEEENKPNTRRVYTEQQVRQVCDYGRRHGAASAARKYGVNERRAQMWLREFKDSLWKSYPELQVRGRREVFTEGMKKEMRSALKITRADEKAPITAAKAAAYAQGVVLKTEGGLLQENGGTYQFGKSWARTFLKKEQFGVYRKTTDRTITSREVTQAASSFFTKVHQVGATRSNMYNVDEFYALLSQDGNAWTWQRKGDRRVAIRNHRAGCTMAVVSSADGAVLGCQLIWQGKTVRCEADVDDKFASQDIWQAHNSESHFQNTETWNSLLRKNILPRVRARKTPVERACILVDAAPQHKLDDETARMFEEAGVWVVQIPERATHVYQAADQYIIASLKGAMVKAWEKYIRLVVANESMSDAMQTIHTKNTSHLKKIKYQLLKKALAAVSEKVVLSSWDMTGVMRAVYNDVPRTHVVLDEHISPPSAIDVDADADESSPNITIEVSDLLIDQTPIANAPEEFRLKRKVGVEEKQLLKEEKRRRKKVVLAEMHEWERVENDAREPELTSPKRAKKRCKQCGRYGHMAKTCSHDDFTFENYDACFVLHNREWLQGKVEEIGENSATVRLAPPYAEEEWEVPLEFLKSAI